MVLANPISPDTLLSGSGALIVIAVVLFAECGLPIAAIIGNLVGYFIGRRAGPLVFDRPNSRLFRPEYVERSQAFYDRFGSWTIIIGRFVPIVRRSRPSS